jgi:hypothetical protein
MLAEETNTRTNINVHGGPYQRQQAYTGKQAIRSVRRQNEFNIGIVIITIHY